MLSESNRTHEIDKKFENNVSNSVANKVKYINYLFIRLVAKDIIFTKIDFKYSIFDTCYLRNCKFDSCDFTGCRFIATNLNGAKFSGCKFDYATFERTMIDSDILDTECPSLENLQMKFARTLRMNYQQLGDVKSANKAINIELQATEIHLHKAWQSKESYYRDKYKGIKRFQMFVEWIQFKIFDFIWGNGESLLKLLRATFIIFCIMTLLDVWIWNFSSIQNLEFYLKVFFQSPQVFLGTFIPPYYPSLYLTIILFIRLVAFGFFMSIIIKRLNRR